MPDPFILPSTIALSLFGVLAILSPFFQTRKNMSDAIPSGEKPALLPANAHVQVPMTDKPASGIAKPAVGTPAPDSESSATPAATTMSSVILLATVLAVTAM
jgi:hypothetical protein